MQQTAKDFRGRELFIFKMWIYDLLFDEYPEHIHVIAATEKGAEVLLWTKFERKYWRLGEIEKMNIKKGVYV